MSWENFEDAAIAATDPEFCLRGSVGFPVGVVGRVGPLPSLPVHATFEDAAIAATRLKSHGSKNLYR